MGLEILGETDSTVWDNMIDDSSQGSLYHSWKWLKIIEKYTYSQLFPLVFFDTRDNKPFGAIPLFFKKKLGIKMVFSPPPGSGIRLGPVLINKGYKQHKFELAYLDFQAKIDHFIKKLGSNYTLIITNPGLTDVRPFSWARYKVNPAYTYKLDLQQGQETIWNNLSDSLRREIKQARKNGIQVVERQDAESIEYIHNSIKQRYSGQGLNYGMDGGYLQDLLQEIGKTSIKAFLAMCGEEIVGGTLCTIYKDTITAQIGGARNTSKNPEANRLIDWEIITRAIRDGYKWYEDFGANTRHLCNSKAKYSPAPYLYFQIQKADFLGYSSEKIYRLRKRRLL